MNSREKLNATLNHQTPDQLCVDFGAGGQTGMAAGAVHRLREVLLGKSDHRVKIVEPYQMLGEFDDALLKVLGADVIGLFPPKTMFGFQNEGWKPFTMHDGTEVLVPEKFNWSVDNDGAILMYPAGDTSVPPSGKMPTGSYFFDAIVRQPEIFESELDPMNNCEEFGVLTAEDLQYYSDNVKKMYDETSYGIYVTIPGMGFGDIGCVPAPWLKNPKGIRDIAEWYMSGVIRKDYVKKVFEIQCEIALQNIELLSETLGDMVQVAFVSGTDFGHQQGLFFSVDTFKELYKPFYKSVNDKIHKLTNWKTFIHSCGAISELIPEFIDAGFDVLNPVQISAANMDARTLKKEFGKEITFWGGGVDTQKTLPFGTPDEVYKEVMERIEIFADGGGFVFNAIHNIQSNVPVENILALVKALNDARGI
ncbi:MAG: methyltransferase [Bacteroidetes bacterium]|nr:methyltransferase [Bacteroidota bacterium]